ncbi:MAG: response regulator [Candidatus Aminicenantes bacterium]|nr:response regulator [Candidatus Aminicenantes bacterium]
MTNTSGTEQIYRQESQLLKKIKDIIDNKSIPQDRLWQEFTGLGREYEKLLRNAVFITRLGDANQKKLIKALHLEKEKQQLERIAKDRAKQIEEKNRQLQKQTVLLKEKSEKLKEMSELKSRFFANISHEFRTPLTLIMGPIEQMLAGKRSKEEEKKLTLILRNSQRLLALIDQLLELSKFEFGKMKLEASLQDIVPFLDGCTASLETLLGQNELGLTYHPEEKNIALYFDREKMEKVIYNLLLNAVKFTPVGGEITVTVKKNREKTKNFPAGSVEISAADTGIGIPPDRLGHIFDRFYQVEGGYESKHKGSGIGLALVKELVGIHHGEIHAFSPGEKYSSGTEFIVRLPLGKAHLDAGEIVNLTDPSFIGKTHAEIRELYLTASEEKENEIKPGEETKTRKKAAGRHIILVVEDSPTVSAYINETLEPFYRIVEAGNGREGIEKAKEVIPDLIISDVLMPEADGYDLCHSLKNDIETSHIPIILLTAKAAQDDIIEGLETGADDYITKPFNSQILLARIKNLIDLRRQLQESITRRMNMQPEEITLSPIDEEFLEELQQMLDKNIANSGFNVEKLCDKLYMSRATLYRKLLALSGESPTEFLRSYRLNKGAELLRKKVGSVVEVSFQVGFSNSSYFSKCFKQKFHRSPFEYKKGD